MNIWDELNRQIKTPVERLYSKPGVRSNSFYVSDSPYRLEESSSLERLRQLLPIAERK